MRAIGVAPAEYAEEYASPRHAEGAELLRYTSSMPEDRLVYSTDGQQRRDLRGPEPDQTARAGGRPARPAKQSPAAPEDGVVRIFRERGGRGGKVVTVIRGLPERGEALERLAGELKRQCGAGGAVKERAVEVQGDHRERLARLLGARGYPVKLAGG